MTNSTALKALPWGLGPLLIERGFEELTPIQNAVLAAERGRDLRISSHTGSGKTIALGFTLAESLEQFGTNESNLGARPIAALVAPTRELAAQVGGELSWLLKPFRVSVVTVTGGASFPNEIRQLRQGPAVVVGTPGRLLDHLRKGHVLFDGLREFVLDEADELLDMGFEEELDAIIAFAPKERRTHLVSATFGRRVSKLADRMQQNPVVLQGAAHGQPHADISHKRMWVHPSDKVAAVVNLLLRYPDDKTLIFVRTRAGASEMADALANRGFRAQALSGEMSQQERTRTFSEFRDGRTRVLVATDVAARGLDVLDIARVVQADLPDEPDVFTHRSGRTGRAGRSGENVMLVPPGARNRQQRLLQRLKVEPEDAAVPSAESILEAADKRLAETIVAGGLRPSKRVYDLAESLLREADPVEAVAQLLASSRHAGPCEPEHVTPITPGGPRRSAGPGSGSGRGAPSGDFVRFQVSWGGTHGADARRMLAVVCRRGGVSRTEVGSISIGAHSSTVEIVAPKAEDFERSAMRPDPRDPRVKFRRWQERGDGPAHKGRAYAGKRSGPPARGGFRKGPPGPKGPKGPKRKAPPRRP